MFGEEMWEKGGTRRKHRLERGEEISGEGGDKRRKWGCENGGFGEVLLKLKLDFIKFKLDLYKFKLNFCKFKFDFIKSKFSFKTICGNGCWTLLGKGKRGMPEKVGVEYNKTVLGTLYIIWNVKFTIC